MMRRIGSKYVGIASWALHIESPVPEYELLWSPIENKDVIVPAGVYRPVKHPVPQAAIDMTTILP